MDEWYTIEIRRAGHDGTLRVSSERHGVRETSGSGSGMKNIHKLDKNEKKFFDFQAPSRL